MEYYQGFISATSKEEAKQIVDELLDKRFIAGGQILAGESNHHWQGDIERLPYWTIMIFTKPDCVDAIIETVERLSKDDTPGVTFVKIERGNKGFLDWIDENTNQGVPKD